MIRKEKNIVITGSAGKPMATDIFFIENGLKKPVIIYAHGFNGFKDWGNFDLIAEQFANNGFVFIKFNFSHNGTAPENPEEFTDLEAFGHNNYTVELNDLELVIKWALGNEHGFADEINADELYLLGHSMGGGVVILHASEDHKVRKIATWASVCHCNTPWGSWDADKMAKWAKTGVEYYINGRTGQKMPLYYQLYKDFELNKLRFDIQQAISNLQIPVLLCHGKNDEAVTIDKAELLHSWHPEAELFIVDSDHVFGRKHPWTEPTLPAPMQQVLEKTIRFFKMR